MQAASRCERNDDATAHPFDPVPLAADLVRIPSCDPPGNESAVARHVAAALAALGLAPVLDEFRPGRANVMARVRGRGEKPALVFPAHLDTVPTGDLPWRFDPFAGDVVEGRLRGRGASDMKSAVAAFIAAADRLNRCDTPLAGDVIVALTAGESSDCLGARHLVAQGFQAEIGAFLCGEPSTLDLIVVEKAILGALNACALTTPIPAKLAISHRSAPRDAPTRHLGPRCHAQTPDFPSSGT